MDIDWNSDLDILTRTLVGEYGIGTYDQIFAVGCVMRNRTINRNGYGSTYRTTCLQPWQFSCWNKGSADRAQLIALRQTSAAYQKCLPIARDVIAGKADTTKNADHYLNKEVTKLIRKDGKLPTWVDESRHTVKVGEHDFYNLTGKWQVPVTPSPRALLATRVFRDYQNGTITEKEARAILLILNK